MSLIQISKRGTHHQDSTLVAVAPVESIGSGGIAIFPPCDSSAIIAMTDVHRIVQTEWPVITCDDQRIGFVTFENGAAFLHVGKSKKIIGYMPNCEAVYRGLPDAGHNVGWVTALPFDQLTAGDRRALAGWDQRPEEVYSHFLKMAGLLALSCLM